LLNAFYLLIDCLSDCLSRFVSGVKHLIDENTRLIVQCISNSVLDACFLNIAIRQGRPVELVKA